MEKPALETFWIPSYPFKKNKQDLSREDSVGLPGDQKIEFHYDGFKTPIEIFFFFHR